MRSTRSRPSPTTLPETSSGNVLRASGRLLLVALLVFPPNLWAATITVSGGCTLPDAINAANTDAPAGGCPAGSGADTIELTGDVTLTAVARYGYGANGLPLVSSDITIAGNGFTIERDSSAPPFRLFFALPSSTLALESVTVSGGSADFISIIYDFGGAILNFFGDLSLTDSTVSGNSSGWIGGGILSIGGSVSLTDSTVSGNSAAVGGGSAIINASLSMTNSSVSGNSAVYMTSYSPYNGIGGGVWMSGGSAVLSDSTVADNYAETTGGGLDAESTSSIELVRSTVSGNEAGDSGGGIRARDGSTTTLTNSTVSGNSSRRSGGGLYLDYAGATTITNTTFSGNYTYGRGGRGASSIYAYYSDVTLSGSVLGNALAYSGVGTHCNTYGGIVTDLGGNLADDSSCGTVPATLTGLDPVLADNGGPTLTHALADTSSAVDAAGACGLATDQRGVARDDGSCDSGAYEFVPPPTPEELVDLLIDTLESLGLPGGLENALVGKLESALASLADGNVGAAINKLGAFVNQVEAQSGKKIDAADAEALIAAAEAVIDLLSG